MNMIKRILLWVLLFNMQVVFGAIKQSSLKDFTEEHEEDIDVGYTSFGAPEYVVSKTENGKKIEETFLLSNQGFYADIPIYGIRSVPTKRPPEESHVHFLEYSREASPKELAPLRKYGVEHLRIIDFDSIIKGLPEEPQQEILHVKAMLEAYQRAIWQGGPLWLRIEDAMLEGVSCDGFFLKGVQEIAGKCAEVLVSGKVDEATKTGTPLEDDAVEALYESTRSSLTKELKSALWGENTVWEVFMCEKITPLHLPWLEASLEDLRAVKQWYDYILRWFERISICPTRRVAVYSQEGIVSDEIFGEQPNLRFEGNFLCEMNPETIEAFRKEFRKDFLKLLLGSIKATPYSPVKCKPEFLVLSLVLLKDLEFSTDYGYYASNLMERLCLALDDMYDKQRGYKHSEDVSEALCGFLSFALYDRLGIMWDYSLVGNLDSALEERLFKLLKAPSGMAPVQLSGDALRLWFGLCEASSETIEMEPQKFYNLIQMVTLHGGPENIWTGVGFASIDGCVYVNRMIMGQSSYVLPYYRHKFSCHTLLSIDKFCTGPKISEKIRSFFLKATPTGVKEILKEVEERANVPKPWHGPKQVGRCDEETLYEMGNPWIFWLQLVSGFDHQREIKQVFRLMDKYLALYTEE